MEGKIFVYGRSTYLNQVSSIKHPQFTICLTLNVLEVCCKGLRNFSVNFFGIILLRKGNIIW